VLSALLVSKVDQVLLLLLPEAEDGIFAFTEVLIVTYCLNVRSVVGAFFDLRDAF